MDIPPCVGKETAKRQADEVLSKRVGLRLRLTRPTRLI